MSSGGFKPTVTLEQLRAAMQAFADERDWAQFHTPRNLMMAMTGEVGELSELFMWKHDAGAAPGLPSWTAAEKEHLGEELSDVLLYLIRLSDRCGIDLPSAAIAKMAKNAKKYPADAARGSSAKYTAYEGGASSAVAAAGAGVAEATTASGTAVDAVAAATTVSPDATAATRDAGATVVAAQAPARVSSGDAQAVATPVALPVKPKAPAAETCARCDSRLYDYVFLGSVFAMIYGTVCFAIYRRTR